MDHISARTTVDQAIYSPEIVIWKALVAIFKISTTKKAHCPLKERKKCQTKTARHPNIMQTMNKNTRERGNPLTIASIAATNRNAHSGQK